MNYHTFVEFLYPCVLAAEVKITGGCVLTKLKRGARQYMAHQTGSRESCAGDIPHASRCDVNDVLTSVLSIREQRLNDVMT